MSPAAKENAPDPVVRRLDVIIALLLRSTNEPTMSEQIRALGDLGLDAVEIGRIVGKPANYVRATLGRKTKTKRQNKKRQ